MSVRRMLPALLLALAAGAPLAAQDDAAKVMKRTVAVVPFSAAAEMYTGAWWQAHRNVNESVRSSTEEAVSSAILKTGRFKMVERSKLPQILQELGTQKQETSLDAGELAKQGQIAGAGLLITGAVQAANIQDVSNNGTTMYSCQIILSLKAVDVASAELMAQDQVKLEPKRVLGIPVPHSTPEGCITSAVRDGDRIKEWINKTFPMQFEILEVTEKEADGRAKKLYIDGGEAMGVQKGMRFDIVEIGQKKIGPKTITVRNKVAVIRVEKTEGDEVALCRVDDGAADLSAKIEAKAKLIVIGGT